MDRDVHGVAVDAMDNNLMDSTVAAGPLDQRAPASVQPLLIALLIAAGAHIVVLRGFVLPAAPPVSHAADGLRIALQRLPLPDPPAPQQRPASAQPPVPPLTPPSRTPDRPTSPAPVVRDERPPREPPKPRRDARPAAPPAAEVTRRPRATLGGIERTRGEVVDALLDADNDPAAGRGSVVFDPTFAAKLRQARQERERMDRIDAMRRSNDTHTVVARHGDATVVRVDGQCWRLPDRVPGDVLDTRVPMLEPSCPPAAGSSERDVSLDDTIRAHAVTP